MSAQPANTSISVYRALRTQRQILRSDSVAAIIKRLRPLVLIKPGEELSVGVLKRDTTTRDFSPYMGQASYSGKDQQGNTRGFPIVIGLLPEATFVDGQVLGGPDDLNTQGDAIKVDFAFTIGGDKFLKATSAANATADLFGLAQAIN